MKLAPHEQAQTKFRPPSMGSNSSFGTWHSDDWIHVVMKIAVRPKSGKDLPKLINLLEVEWMCICENKMDYDLADSKSTTRARTRWRGFHRREAPTNLRKMVDGANGTNETTIRLSNDGN